MHAYRSADARASRDMRQQQSSERPFFEDDAMLGFRRTNASPNDMQDEYGYNEYDASAQRQSGRYQTGSQQRQQSPQNRHNPRDNLRELGFWHEDDSESNYDDSEADTDRPSPLKFVIAVTGLVFICTITWLAYRWISLPTTDAPPLIQADQTPYRVRPDNPGGTNFPHQDKLIYGRLAPGTEQPVERLLPAPEQPVIMAPDYNQPNGQPQNVQPQNTQQGVAAQAGGQPAMQPGVQGDNYANVNQPGQATGQATVNTPGYAPDYAPGYAPPSAQGQGQVQVQVQGQPNPQNNQAIQLVPGQAYSVQQYPNQAQPSNPSQPTDASQMNMEPDFNGLPQNKNNPPQQQQIADNQGTQPQGMQNQMAQNPATFMEQTAPIDENQNQASNLDMIANASDIKAAPTDTAFYGLQLGTLINLDLAKKEKARLQKRYAGELKGMDLNIKSFVANDGTKKYRIITPPTIQSRKAALDKCATLGNACIPIKN
jgi:hypothetical protein